MFTLLWWQVADFNPETVPTVQDLAREFNEYAVPQRDDMRFMLTPEWLAGCKPRGCREGDGFQLLQHMLPEGACGG